RPNGSACRRSRSGSRTASASSGSSSSSRIPSDRPAPAAPAGARARACTAPVGGTMLFPKWIVSGRGPVDTRGRDKRQPRPEPVRAHSPAGFFVGKEGAMANHLTPEELSKELGLDRDDVIRLCVEEGVPIYHGKIDKTLFQAQLKAVRAAAAESA